MTKKDIIITSAAAAISIYVIAQYTYQRDHADTFVVLSEIETGKMLAENLDTHKNLSFIGKSGDQVIVKFDVDDYTVSAGGCTYTYSTDETLCND